MKLRNKHDRMVMIIMGLITVGMLSCVVMIVFAIAYLLGGI